MGQKIEGFQIGEVSRIWTPDLQFQNLIAIRFVKRHSKPKTLTPKFELPMHQVDTRWLIKFMHEIAGSNISKLLSQRLEPFK